MTIYESLGIDHLLLNLDIPKDTIIENIPKIEMQNQAKLLFLGIENIKLQASIHRGDHYLQILEIRLNEPHNIESISFLIQKAIRYRVLFVFIYDERYLLLWRNFNLTESTENVYSEHTTHCTDWIYGEFLHEDLLASCQTKIINSTDEDSYFIGEKHLRVTDDDNGDFLFFADILNNVIKLHNAMVETDYVSYRYLTDWLITHSVGRKVDAVSIYKRAIENSSYTYFANRLFFEKNAISFLISELEESTYWRFINHTGRHPINYFDGIVSPSTYDDELELVSSFGQILNQYELNDDGLFDWYDEDDALNDMEEEGKVTKSFSGGIRNREIEDRVVPSITVYLYEKDDPSKFSRFVDKRNESTVRKYNSDYQLIKQFWLPYHNDISMSLYSVTKSSQGLRLKFWISNSGSKPKDIWIRECRAVDRVLDKRIKIASIQPDTYNWYVYEAPIEATDYLSVLIEVDEEWETIQEYPELFISLNDITGEVIPSYEKPKINNCNRASVSFDKYTNLEYSIISNHLINLEFEYFSCKENLVKYWIYNRSNSTIQIWVENLELDGDTIVKLERIQNIAPKDGKYVEVGIKSARTFGNHQIKLNFDISDENYKTIEKTRTMVLNLYMDQRRYTFDLI